MLDEHGFRLTEVHSFITLRAKLCEGHGGIASTAAIQEDNVVTATRRIKTLERHTCKWSPSFIVVELRWATEKHGRGGGGRDKRESLVMMKHAERPRNHHPKKACRFSGSAKRIPLFFAILGRRETGTLSLLGLGLFLAAARHATCAKKHTI